ncbi:hypothetical protein DCO56_00025 [Sphingobacterium athyrii]|uniref:Uncharacterized protein n=1 Tax=Sphingobacterium athyrii TaxID=2152717 RepID=A0A363NXA6_9SPHI|nr:hypothetical protein DCO56_00025 [Sphingobacterium athyrii]
MYQTYRRRDREALDRGSVKAENTEYVDRVIPAVTEWRNRPLEPIYPFIFLNCIHFKVREQLCSESCGL